MNADDEIARMKRFGFFLHNVYSGRRYVHTEGRHEVIITSVSEGAKGLGWVVDSVTRASEDDDDEFTQVFRNELDGLWASLESLGYTEAKA